jgi:hypothetical protein
VERWRDDNAWQAAYFRALRGVVGDLVEQRDAMLGNDPTGPRAAAASALLWFAGVPGHSIPAISALPDPSRSDPEGVAAFAASRVAQAGFLAFDAGELGAARAWLEKAALETRERHATAFASLATAWAHLLAGADVDDEALARAGQEGAALRRPDLAIEAAATRALARASAGDLDQALAEARGASQSAASARLPQPTYFANIVLARIRRLRGRWYLATRILTSLLRSASTPWRRWLTWELTFAQGDAPHAEGPAADVAAALRAAKEGDRARYDAFVAAAEGGVRGHACLARDLAGLRSALEVSPSQARIHQELRDWRDGKIDAPPFGLLGLQAGHESMSPSYVLVRPGLPSVRVLGLGAALVAGTAHSVALEPTQRKQGRVDSLIAALALCGATGAQEDELFVRVYGFRYVPLLHRDVLTVALHRARARLLPHADIVAEAGRRILVCRDPLLVADPRCAPPIDERVLLEVAHQRNATAKGIADELGMPLRTAQASLKRLVDEGLCRMNRDGRGIEYGVEDTTFQDPTWSGLPRSG